MTRRTRPVVSAIAGIIVGFGTGSTHAGGLLDALDEVTDKVDQVKDQLNDLGDSPRDAREAVDRTRDNEGLDRRDTARDSGTRDTRPRREQAPRQPRDPARGSGGATASAPANAEPAVTQYMVAPGEFMPAQTRDAAAMPFNREKVRYWLQTKVALTNHETRLVAIGEKPNRPMRERFLQAMGWDGEEGFNATKNRIVSAVNVRRGSPAMRAKMAEEHTDRYGSDPGDDWQAVAPYKAYWEDYDLDAVDHGLDYRNGYADLSKEALRPDKTLDPGALPLNGEKVLYWLKTRRAAVLLHKRLMAREDVVDFQVFEPAVNDLLTGLGWSTVPRSDFARVGARIYSAYNLMGADQPLPRYIGDATRRQAFKQHKARWGHSAQEDWKALKPYLEEYERMGRWVAGKTDAAPELPAL
ncbi:MAG TPA: hypothetical protein VKA64_07045 [Gammaproteobacteria bacterium]|nr:hypothetical protein [Gammaproteobacteria bacterium]